MKLTIVVVLIVVLSLAFSVMEAESMSCEIGGLMACKAACYWETEYFAGKCDEDNRCVCDPAPTDG